MKNTIIATAIAVWAVGVAQAQSVPVPHSLSHDFSHSTLSGDSQRALYSVPGNQPSNTTKDNAVIRGIDRLLDPSLWDWTRDESRILDYTDVIKKNVNKAVFWSSGISVQQFRLNSSIGRTTTRGIYISTILDQSRTLDTTLLFGISRTRRSSFWLIPSETTSLQAQALINFSFK